MLITRKHKILQDWLNGVLPLAEFELSPEGVLTFTNIAVDVKAAQPATEHRVRWFAFDNQTGTATPVGDEAASPDLSAKAPGRSARQAPRPRDGRAQRHASATRRVGDALVKVSAGNRRTSGSSWASSANPDP